MEAYFLFVIKATCSLSVFYLVGLLLFRNDTKFKLHRFYMLSAVVIAFLLPFNTFSLRVSSPEKQAIIPVQRTNINEEVEVSPNTVALQPGITMVETTSSVDFYSLSYKVYWIITVLLVLRIVYSLARVFMRFTQSERERFRQFTIIYQPLNSASYSFFRWVFVSTEVKDSQEKQNIINHELVHASQFHSIDVIVVELLTAVMWFNPFIWLMRKWMQQLHEYLADDGVVKSGTNVLEYQALLVNQVAGERLICLPSGFNQSLIKKRLAMMTKTKINKKSGYRLLMLIPLTALIFIMLSFTNKSKIVKVEKSASNPLITNSFSTNTAKTPKVAGINQKKTVKFAYPAVSQDTTKHQKVHLTTGTSSNVETVPPPPSNTGTMVPPPPPPQTNVKTPLPPYARVVTAVAPTKMNVLYLGVDNPLSIAVSGVADDKLTIETDNGEIIKDKLMYVARPKQVGIEHIHVYTEINGKKLHMGEMEFRVKIIPEPVAEVAGKKGGDISRVLLLSQMMIVADLENFDFDARFIIIKFTFSVNKNGQSVDIVSNNNKITDEQKKLIKEAKVGDKVVFSKINAVGPDGRPRSLNDIVFQITE